MANRAALTTCKLHSVNQFGDSVERYNLLNILLFEKSLLCYLELIEEFIFPATSTRSLEAASFEATEDISEH